MRKSEREREKNNLEQSRNKVTTRREYRDCLKSVAVACSPLSRQLTVHNKSLFPSFDSLTLHSSLKTRQELLIVQWWFATGFKLGKYINLAIMHQVQPLDSVTSIPTSSKTQLVPWTWADTKLLWWNNSLFHKSIYKEYLNHPLTLSTPGLILTQLSIIPGV